MRKRNSNGSHLRILRDRIHSPQIAPFQFELLRQPSPRPWCVLQAQSRHHRLLPRLGKLPAQKTPALWVSRAVGQPMRLIRTPPGWRATRNSRIRKRIRSQLNHPRFGDTSSVLAMMAATAWDTAILSRQSMIRPMAKTLHSFRVLPAHSPGRRVLRRSFQPVRVTRIASQWQAAALRPASRAA